MIDSTRRWYDSLAPNYDKRWAHYIEATVRETIDGLNPKPDERILDLATGTGEVGRRLTENRPDLRVVGADLSFEMLTRGRSKNPESLGGRLVQTRAERLPFADETFDRVLCASGFHHFRRPDLALEEIRRVLKPDGSFTLVDWCDDFLTCRICSIYLGAFDPSHNKIYTLAQCRDMLVSAGFKILKSRRFKIDWLWGLMRFDALKPKPEG